MCMQCGKTFEALIGFACRISAFGRAQVECVLSDLSIEYCWMSKKSLHCIASENDNGTQREVEPKRLVGEALMVAWGG